MRLLLFNRWDGGSVEDFMDIWKFVRKTTLFKCVYFFQHIRGLAVDSVLRQNCENVFQKFLEQKKIVSRFLHKKQYLNMNLLFASTLVANEWPMQIFF